MIITFTGVSGENRKELVKAISEAIDTKSVYQGMPRCAYKIGPYSVDKAGCLEADDFADQKEIGQLLLALRARDFVPNEDWSMLEEPPAQSELEACLRRPGVEGIILSFPRNGMNAKAVENLKKLVHSKEWLLRMALEAEALSIEEDDDALHFPWLAGTAPFELVEAAAQLIAAMIKLAKKQKRVTLVAKESDNPRYALRCFLLRLGFIGDEYKDVRKVLMRDLPGNSSARHIAADEPVASGE